MPDKGNGSKAKPKAQMQELSMAVQIREAGVFLAFSAKTELVQMTPAQSVDLGRTLIKAGRKAMKGR